jgi:hypothetical protein
MFFIHHFGDVGSDGPRWIAFLDSCLAGVLKEDDSVRP